MSDQPQPGYRGQPTTPSSVSWSQVTNYLKDQNAVLMFLAVVAALFIAYNLAEQREVKRAHTSRQRNVPPKPEEGE